MLNDIIHKHNNIFHRTIKIKPIGVTSGSYAEHNEDSNVPNLNSKLMIASEYQKTKKNFLKDTHKIFQKKFVVSKIKNIFPWTYVISDLNGEPTTGSCYEKELQKKKITKNLE